MASAQLVFDGAVTLAPGSTLHLQSGAVVHNATDVQVGDGATLRMSPSTTLATDARIAGGSVTTTGTGRLRVDAANTSVASASCSTLDGVAFDGTMDLSADLSLARLVNGSTFTGTARYSAAGAKAVGSNINY